MKPSYVHEVNSHAGDGSVMRAITELHYMREQNGDGPKERKK